MASTSRLEAKEQKRAQILEEASRIIADVGFASMRLGDVGAAVGISGPGLYRYFESKEVLLSAILVDISTRLLDGAQAIMRRHGDERAGKESGPDFGEQEAVEILQEFIAFHIDVCIEEPNYVRVQEREHWRLVAVDSEKIRALQRSYMNLWTDMLLQARPEFDRPTARMRVQLSAGLIASSRYVHHWADRQVLRTQLSQMAVAAMFA